MIFRQNTQESLEFITVITNNNHPGIGMDIREITFIFCMEMKNIFQYGHEGPVFLVFQPADHVVVQRCSMDHVLDKPPPSQVGPDTGMPCRVIHEMYNGIRYCAIGPGIYIQLDIVRAMIIPFLLPPHA